MGHILVLDVGTSSMRGILFDGDGRILHVLQRQYRVVYRSDAMAEQDPRDWEDALFAILRDHAAWAGEKGIEISALSLTAQRSSVIPVTEEGTPLCDAIMWLDKRNAPLCRELAPMEGEIFRATGARLNTVFSATKMTWLRRNEPGLYRKTYKLLTIADYLAHLLTGVFRTDHTYGSRSLLMDIRTRRWHRGMLDLFQVEEEKLCELVPPGSILGRTTAAIADLTGIPAGLPLVSAGGDQQCAALGMGVIEQGDMEITTGTGGFLLAHAERVPEDLRPDAICGAHAIPGRYVLEASILSCASLYDWFLDQFYRDVPAGELYGAIEADVSASPAGAGGCLALPYFQGRGTPDWNSRARGGFLNVSLHTGRADMARALLEAIALEAAGHVELLERYTGRRGYLFISGGLARSAEFDRIQASAYGRDILQSDNAEQTALGAWASAAVTLGLWSGYSEALARAKEEDHITTYRPRPDWAAVYRTKRAEMERLYGLLYGGADRSEEETTL